MVTISHETEAEAVARLRRVFREATFEWLPGTWCFVEGDEALRDRRAVAVVRSARRASALCPAGAADEGVERFRVFRVMFPHVDDNSGFIGWLASVIKSETGSGITVVCGYDRRNGGVFDYWGVPESVAGEVRGVLDRIRSPRHDSLDGAVMTVRSVSRNARIGAGTVFCFRQDGQRVTARYGGGPIADGWLVGTVDEAASVVDFRYLQLGTDGEVCSGHSSAHVERQPDGRRQLIEHFTAETGQGRGVNRLEEIDIAVAHPSRRGRSDSLDEREG